MSVKKDTKKTLFNIIIPILLSAVFIYGAYSFFYEFKRLENTANIVLNLILMIIPFGGLLSFYLFKKENKKSNIVVAFIISIIFICAVGIGLPFLINTAFCNNEQWDFSVTVALQVIVFAAVVLILSYFISSSKKAVSILKAVIGIAVSELTLKGLAATVMAIIIFVNGFIGTAFGNPRDNITYTPYTPQEKQKRADYKYTPSENDIYVHIKSQNGDGSEENPFKTVKQAKEKVKELRKSGVTDHINVWIFPGEYVIEEPLAFDNTDAQNVSYIAFPGANPSFTGAKALSDWYEDTQNGVKVFAANVPKGLSFNAMVKNGKTLPKTRYPESGYLNIETEDHTNSLWTEETKKWEYNLGDTEFIGNSQYNPKSIKNIENVSVRILHYWVTDFAYLKGYDSRSNKYTLQVPTTMTVKSGDRYYFENIFEELNSPGEWYLDSDKGKVYYVPCEGETTENTVIYACFNDKLIDVNSAENIDFYGIEFKNTNFTYPEVFDDLNFFYEEKIKAPQAEIDVGGAVEVKNSKNINFTNCNFINIGNTALKFNKLVKNCKIEGCLFENIGATGVFINGYNTENEPEITENIQVINNRIAFYGQNWMSAIGVLQTNARNCTIKNNEISDGYYTAISVGWVWGYGFNITCNNIIQDNLIYNIGQGSPSDKGGIYTLGTQKGTILSGNVIHNVAADAGQGGYGGWGIYLDEGSSYIEVKNNLVYNCGSEGFHQHYGKENTVENNIFALSKNGQIKSTRLEEHNQFHFKNNIVLTDNTPAYNLTEKGKFTDSDNLYWDLSNGKYVFFTKTDDSQYLNRMYNSSADSVGYAKNAVYENPEFKDPENGDFTIADGNTAIEKINFTSWDYTKAGTITDFSK